MSENVTSPSSLVGDDVLPKCHVCNENDRRGEAVVMRLHKNGCFWRLREGERLLSSLLHFFLAKEAAVEILTLAIGFYVSLMLRN